MNNNPMMTTKENSHHDAPGAGSAPPELAGRDDVLERASVMLDRLVAGKHTRGFIFYGLRGVGKTVLLQRIILNAEANSVSVVEIEAPEDQSLPAYAGPSFACGTHQNEQGESGQGHGKASVWRVVHLYSRYKN